MFGYVRPYKSYMLVCEYDEYKAIYCTLCKNLGKYYNKVTRMALNYDLTFYALLSLDLAKDCPKLKKGKCVVNPLKKCNFMTVESDSYHKAAAVTVLMTYHKILDNLKDDGFLKSFSSRLLLPFINGSAKKAKREFPLIAEILEDMTKEQSEIEQNNSASIDACCEPTAKALARIFEDISPDDKPVLKEMGYFLGRWIYTMDAADDLKKDLKDNSFNPLKRYFAIEGDAVPEERQKEIDEGCNQMLNNNVARIIAATNLLNLNRYGGIVGNITEMGLPQVQKEILFLHIREKERKKV